MVLPMACTKSILREVHDLKVREASNNRPPCKNHLRAELVVEDVAWVTTFFADRVRPKFTVLVQVVHAGVVGKCFTCRMIPYAMFPAEALHGPSQYAEPQSLQLYSSHRSQ